MELNFFNILGIFLLLFFVFISFIIVGLFYIKYQNEDEQNFKGEFWIRIVLLFNMTFAIFVLFLLPFDVMSCYQE